MTTIGIGIFHRARKTCTVCNGAGGLPTGDFVFVDVTDNRGSEGIGTHRSRCAVLTPCKDCDSRGYVLDSKDSAASQLDPSGLTEKLWFRS
jgi:DnaJ-class molecular chaperone